MNKFLLGLLIVVAAATTGSLLYVDHIASRAVTGDEHGRDDGGG